MGYNVSGTVATVPDNHTFTITGVADPAWSSPRVRSPRTVRSPDGASFTNVSSRALTAQSFTSAGKGDLTYTTGTPHGLVKNQVIDISGSTPTGYNRNAAVVTAVGSPTTFTVAGIPENPYAISAITSNACGLVTVTTSTAHGLATNNVVSISGNSNAGYNVNNVNITVTTTTKFTYQLPSNPGASGATKGNVLSPNPGASTVLGSVSTIAGVTLSTPKAIPARSPRPTSPSA